MKEPLVVSWSGGKDSARALYEILQRDEFEILALLTTVTDVYDQNSENSFYFCGLTPRMNPPRRREDSK